MHVLYLQLNIHCRQSKYSEGEDFIVLDVEDNVNEQLLKLWSNSLLQSSQTKSKQRYIVIIDRRNPINLQKKMIGIPEIDIPDKYGKIKNPKKTWKDKLYFIVPKVYNQLPPSCIYQYLPESSNYLSSKFIFPNPDKS